MSSPSWGWPLNAKKAHVFLEGRSLCGRWLFLGNGAAIEQAPLRKGPDDCAKCFTRVVELFFAATRASDRVKL